MELLLSQDRVVTLLYEKTFPARRAAEQQGAQSAWQGELLRGEDDDDDDDDDRGGEMAATGEGFGQEDRSTLGSLSDGPTFDHFPSPEGVASGAVSSPAAYLRAQRSS
jgi:hypothetical protein